MKPTTPPPSTGAPSAEPPPRGAFTLVGTIALAVLAIGGLNWGAVGLFDVDLVASLFGTGSVPARVVDLIVGVAAVYCLARLPRWSRAG